MQLHNRSLNYFITLYGSSARFMTRSTSIAHWTRKQLYEYVYGSVFLKADTTNDINTPRTAKLITDNTFHKVHTKKLCFPLFFFASTLNATFFRLSNFFFFLFLQNWILGWLTGLLLRLWGHRRKYLWILFLLSRLSFVDTHEQQQKFQVIFCFTSRRCCFFVFFTFVIRTGGDVYC